MANFKRKKSKRSVRCTLCTPLRWLGNKSDRRKASEQRKDQSAREAILDIQTL